MNNDMKKITIIAGARPNFMKIAPIIHAIFKGKIRGASNRLQVSAYRAALR